MNHRPRSRLAALKPAGYRLGDLEAAGPGWFYRIRVVRCFIAHKSQIDDGQPPLETASQDHVIKHHQHDSSQGSFWGIQVAVVNRADRCPTLKAQDVVKSLAIRRFELANPFSKER